MSVIRLPFAVTGKVWHQLLLVSSLILTGFVASGCAATGTDNLQKPVSALAKPGNTYVVRRAAVRTPSTYRAQRQQAAKRPPVRQPTVARANQRSQRQSQGQLSRQLSRRSPGRSSGQLTKAQYHARYQAQKKAAARAAVKRRQAEAQARLAQKKAQQQAVRQQYVAKWQQQQQKRAQYNRNWKQRTVAAVRKQPTKKVIQASRPVRHAQKQTRKQIQKQARKPDPRQKYLLRWERKQAEKRLEAKKAEHRVERVINNAKKQIGRKYVWGGASPRQGFDCSGLVQHSIKKGANVKVPRTALQQYRAAVKVPAQQAERGDLVFFITRGKKVSHVGIYLGDNKFVHAPRTGQRVKTSTIKGFWKKRLVGFGRIPGACRLPV